MTNITDRITPEMSEEEVLGVILDEIMARAEPDVAEAIRFCAIPHWFSEEIIAWLRGEGLKSSEHSREILAALTELTFVGPYYGQDWTYHENVRELLLIRWRKTDDQHFVQLSQVMVDYFGEKMKSAAGDEFERCRQELMYHFLPVDPSAGLELFNQMLKEAKDSQRASTCQLLVHLFAEETIIRAVAGLDVTQTVNVLIPLLYESISDIRSEAARTLGMLKAEDGIETLVRVLTLDGGSSVSAISDALAKINSKKAVDILLEIVMEKRLDMLTLYNVSRALAVIKDTRAIEPLAQRISYPSQDVQCFVVSALAEIGTDEALQPLLSALFLGHGDDVRRLAIEALAKVNPRQAQRELLRELDNENSVVRYWAVEALARFGDREAIPHIQKVVRESGDIVTWGGLELRKTAANAIAQIEARLEESKR
ncbi:MAG: HEAT repeat domain-containing protein [Anaerolineae bacterium]